MNVKDRHELPAPQATLPGRSAYAFPVATHALWGHGLSELPPGQRVCLGMGCFWGAERLFWQREGVTHTAVGYAGGKTPFPTYQEVCGGLTGHAEVVEVVFDPQQLSLESLLRCFWEAHDPTSGMRQGNDVGTQYRSAIYVESAADLRLAEASRDHYARRLAAAGRGPITTEIAAQLPFFLAEPMHQQYLHKNPQGYCGLAGTQISFDATS